MLIAQRVSNNGRHFDYVDDLKEAITSASYEIEEETLKKPVSSMPRRLIAVLDSRGGPID